MRRSSMLPERFEFIAFHFLFKRILTILLLQLVVLGAVIELERALRSFLNSLFGRFNYMKYLLRRLCCFWAEVMVHLTNAAGRCNLSLNFLLF